MNKGDMLQFDIVFTPLPGRRLPPDAAQTMSKIPVRIAKPPKMPRKLKKRMKKAGYRIQFQELRQTDDQKVWNHFATWTKITATAEQEVAHVP